MAQTLRGLTGLNTDVVDTRLTGRTGAFVGKVPTRLLPTVRGDLDVSPNTPVAYNDEISFVLPRAGDLVGHVVFTATASALASGGAGANFPRWRDAFTYQLIKEVHVLHEGNKLAPTLTGEAIYMIHKVMRASDDSYDALSYAGLQADAAGRATLATGAVEIYLDLPLFWTFSQTTYLPIAQDFVRGQVTITIRLASLAEITETDGAATTGGVLSNVRLRCEYYWLFPAEREKIAAETKAFSELANDTGRAMIVPAFTVQRFPVASSTDEQQFNLNSRHPVREIIFGTVTNANRPTNGTAANFFGYAAIANWKFRALSLDIVQSRTGLYSKSYDMVNAHSGPATINLYGRSWSLNPEQWIDQLGYLNFNPMDERILSVTLASAAASTLTVLVHSMTVVNLTETGDYYQLFT